MLFKYCRCGKMIPQTMKMCAECEAQQPSRHVEYNHKRRSKRAAAFYNSPPWKRKRGAIITDYDGVDILAYYVFKEVLPCNEVHHIEELEDAWSKRFDDDNLIPLHHNTHTYITRLYMSNKAVKKQVQKALCLLVDFHYGRQGDIEKVLLEMQNVAPSLFLGKNSPPNISDM